MPREVEQWACEYCGETFDTWTECEGHEEDCEENPKNIAPRLDAENWVKVVHVQDTGKRGYACQNSEEPKNVWVKGEVSGEFEELDGLAWEVFLEALTEDGKAERLVYPNEEFRELFVAEENVPEEMPCYEAIQAMPSWKEYSKAHRVF